MRPDICADALCTLPCNGTCPRATAYCPVCRRSVPIKGLEVQGPVAIRPDVLRVRATGTCGHKLGASDKKNGSCLAMTASNINLVRLMAERRRHDGGAD